MSFPPSFLDELRARVGLVDTVRRSVKLQKAGREWKGCCPFHNEKTPSFYVNEDKAFYHCFGCGVHGDVIRFVSETEGLRFVDTIKQLAGQAGMALPEQSPEAEARAKRAGSLREVTKAGALWFTERLNGLAGAEARRYLEQRGITSETAAAFGLGFAPDGNRMRTALKEIDRDKLIEVGLLGRSEERGDLFDRFRNRVMFPIRDARGEVIAFGGRILGEGQPKYLNSPDTPLFDKGRTLYNLDRALPAARKSMRLFVVEGYMDVIALAQAGIAEAVAPLGTALTDAQLQLLWRAVPEPVLCFDGDRAGQGAAVRAALRALPLLEPGRSLRFAMMPQGQDPDDIVRAGGLEAFEAIGKRTVTLVDLIWRAETDGADLRTPERRAAAREKLKEHVETIADASIRSLYANEFRSRFDAMFAPRSAGAARAAAPARRAERVHCRPADVPAVGVLALMIDQPALAEQHLEGLAMLPLQEPRFAELRNAMLDLLAGGLDSAEDLPRLLIMRGLDDLVEETRRVPRFGIRDVAGMIANLAAQHQVEADLAAVTARLKDSLNDEDFAEQQRLRAERMRVEDEWKRMARGGEMAA